MDFVHLHVHTQYSLLDGAIRLPELMAKVKEYHLPAVAMTDHGNLFGVIEFYEMAKDFGIKPIIGCEVYLAPHGYKKKAGKENLYHLVLLAENERGYHNLLKLVSISHLEGFYYKPRIDKELLNEYHEGLIGLSACLHGEVPLFILKDNYEEAKRAAKDYEDILGKGNFYLELQDNGLEEQIKTNEGLIKLSNELCLPIVATNDCHYLRPEDAEAHDILLCIQTGKNINDKNRLRFSTDQFYFKSKEEMINAFSNYPQAIKNTMAIAERCQLELQFGKYRFPKFHVPEGTSLSDFLIEKAKSGLKRKFILHGLKETDHSLYFERLEKELDVINQMGFASYFLIVSDFATYAKKNGIPVGPGRGSAAGSLVAYALDITEIDPISYGLLFERFLNPERRGMPDIDVDLCMEGREEVLKYVSRKYGGRDHVAQIITFGKMQARAVIRDVGRALDMPYQEVDKIAKLVPAIPNISLEEATANEPRLSALAAKNPTIKRLLTVARALEGLPRHASTHAAGVVVSDRPLAHYVPLYRGTKGEVVTQFDMKGIEQVGLVKFDLLGLKTLTSIQKTLELIEKNHKVKIELSQIDLKDKATYKLLCQGDTCGVFQLESPGMRDLLKRLKPSCFEDLVAIVALYRPGPLESGMIDEFIKRKHGKISIKYELPQLESILKETYGVVVYQEQVMEIAVALAGYTLGEADVLRKAMGKKKPEIMVRERSRFLEGATGKGIEKEKAEHIFDLIEKFGRYGFNKCVIGSTKLVDVDKAQIITVQELYNRAASINTLSCDENTLKIVKKPVVNVVKNGIKDVFKLITELGKEIVVTDNHPFLTLEGWKELKELKINDRIALPRLLPIESTRRWPDYKLITLAGVLSEGNTCHPSGFYYYNNDKIQIDNFVKSLKRFPNTVPTITQRNDGRYEVYAGTGRYTRFSKGHVPWNKKGEPKAKFERSGARIWLEELGLIYKKSSQKFIPKEIFSLCLENIALFLGRLWSGDGFIFSKAVSIPYYATSSKVFAEDIQNLLLRFRIVSRIRKKIFKYKNNHRLGYTIMLLGRESIENFITFICPYIISRNNEVKALKNYYSKISPNLESKDTVPSQIKEIVKKEKLNFGLSWRELERRSRVSMKEFPGGIKPYKKGFRRITLLRLAKFFSSQRLLKYAQSDIYWDKVSKIIYVGKEETYDIEVKDTHNFIANGIIVHNSHSTAYALIAYRTAYLKAHYPLEFMASLLTCEMGSTDEIVKYINECQEKGIKILSPDVNLSEADFMVEKGKIRFCLAAIKNVGGGAIFSILDARKDGPFSSLVDFCERVEQRRVNRRVIESLIKAGAFDDLGAKRKQLMFILPKAIEIGQRKQRQAETAQLSLFAKEEVELSLPEMEEWPEEMRLANEKDALGIYLTGHPLRKYQQQLIRLTDTNTEEISHLEDGAPVTIGGTVRAFKEIDSRRGEKMAFITLEDIKGFVEVIIFSEVYKKASTLIKSDKPLLVKGEIGKDETLTKIIAHEICPLSEVMQGQKKGIKAVHIKLRPDGLKRAHLLSIKDIIKAHPGDCPVYLHLLFEKEVVVSLPSQFYIRPSEDFVETINDSLGYSAVEIRH